jgi:hypothetical protein
VFTVRLSAASSGIVQVSYATADDSALAGSDYTARSGVLSFNPGQLTKTLSVPVRGDRVAETDQRFFVNLTNPSNATLADAQGAGTIVNDDHAALLVNTTSVREPATGTVNAVFTVVLTIPSELTVSVAVSTANVTAMAGSDYVGIPQSPATTVTFAPLQTTRTFNVAVKADKQRELPEVFIVNLSSPTNAEILLPLGLGIILDR